MSLITEHSTDALKRETKAQLKALMIKEHGRELLEELELI